MRKSLISFAALIATLAMAAVAVGQANSQTCPPGQEGNTAYCQTQGTSGADNFRGGTGNESFSRALLAL